MFQLDVLATDEIVDGLCKRTIPFIPVILVKGLAKRVTVTVFVAILVVKMNSIGLL